MKTASEEYDFVPYDGSMPGREYFDHNYGTCVRPDGCECLRRRIWLGTLCPAWVPAGVSSYDELKAWQSSPHSTEKPRMEAFLRLLGASSSGTSGDTEDSGGL